MEKEEKQKRLLYEGVVCPLCLKLDREVKGNLIIRTGKNGQFLACDLYPECGFTADYNQTDTSLL